MGPGVAVLGDKKLETSGGHTLIKRGRRYYDMVEVEDTPIYSSVCVVARRRRVVDEDGSRPKTDESARTIWRAETKGTL